MNGFYKFAMNVMRVIMPLWYRIETYGTENLPEDSGYLFISNHRSMADPILIGVQNPETQFCFLAKQELFSAGLVGWLLRKLGAIAVDRGSGDTTALEEIEYRLQNGENALIFPEGTRSKDGKLGHFKTGAALIAAQTGVPVIPVAISFDDEKLRFRSTICVRYGEPFQIPRTDASNPSVVVLKQVRQEMTKNVSALLEMNTADADDSTAEKAEKKESEVTERTMSKNNNNHQNNHNNKKKKPTPEREALKKIKEEIADEAEEIVDEAEDVVEETTDEIEESAEEILDDTADEAEDEADDEDDDDTDDSDEEEEAEPVDEDDFVTEDDDDEDDDAPALPFKFSNPFKKLLKKDSVDDEDFDDDDEDDEDDEEDEDDNEDLTEDDADLDDDDDDDDDGEKPALFGGFSLKNAFKKKPAAESDDLELDADFDDDFEDYDEESAEGDDDDEYDDDDDEVVAAKGVDYGRIALILTFVILAIFAIDFFRRLVNDWKSTQGMLDIQSQASSMVESMSGDSDTELTPAMTTAPENPENASTVATTTEGEAAETTTTTTEYVDDRDTQTVTVDNKAMHSGSLVLIDSTHQQVDAPDLVTFASFEPQHLRLVSTNMQVDASLAAPIINWFNDFFTNTGLGNIMVYNTIDTPAYPPYSTAIPERSSGLALDLAILNEAAQSHSPYTPDGTYAWLTEHAADYGFIVRYPNGKNDKTGLDGMTWHFRYVGAPHAKYMYDNDLCLEEYLLELQNHTWEKEHLTTTVNNTEYEIYYIPASETEDTTEIKYPVSTTGAQPIISGDNNNGFVVAMPKD